MVSEYMSCYPDYVKTPLIFYKDNANREQNNRTRSNNYAKMQLIF